MVARLRGPNDPPGEALGVMGKAMTMRADFETRCLEIDNNESPISRRFHGCFLCFEYPTASSETGEEHGWLCVHVV